MEQLKTEMFHTVKQIITFNTALFYNPVHNRHFVYFTFINDIRTLIQHDKYISKVKL